jgi:hypothetical protein
MEAAMNWLCRFAAVGIALFPSANSVAVASTLNAALVTALVKMNGDYSTFTLYENATVAAETGHTRPAMDWSTLVGDIENQAKGQGHKGRTVVTSLGFSSILEY